MRSENRWFAYIFHDQMFRSTGLDASKERVCGYMQDRQGDSYMYRVIAT
jgi:hypothetical protein